MADDQSGDETGGFEHPSDDEIDVVDMDEPFDLDEVDEGNPADLGDDITEERIGRLRDRAAEMKGDGGETITVDEAPDDGLDDLEGTPADPDAAEGTPVRTRSEPDEADDADVADGGSLFSDAEADELEDQFGDQEIELEPVEDIPADFDYEAQDTAAFGTEDEMVIEHNGTYFKLEAPEGREEEQFWMAMENQTTMVDAFDAMIEYAVARPDDIATRMEEENWTSFAKAGLAIKCSAFLGLDQLQDF